MELGNGGDEYCRTPPKWTRPEDVMKLHKLKMKKRALQNRFSAVTSNHNNVSKEGSEKSGAKQKACRNPFRLNRTIVEGPPLDETSTDGTLFRLLNFPNSIKTGSCSDGDISFTDVLKKLGKPPVSTQESTGGSSELSVDWTLRTKARLMSTKPFPWNRKLKTCEEASGITGFVRCIDTAVDRQMSSYNLDTSPNARFHQCCLLWQHPSIPWLELSPRIGTKLSSQNVISLLAVKDSLYNDWVQSFHSLFQLTKAKQCPYFYVLGNTFTCLFRAAGIASYSDMNAMITPTTRGFRQLLKNEDIEFSMPLKQADESTQLSRSSFGSDDTGYETLDVASELEDVTDIESTAEDVKIEEAEETDEWLEKMGVEAAEIKRLNNSQYDVTVGREKQVDSTAESLIFVEGSETQALFNFLMNCKSVIPTTGIFAGIPPTLIAPIAFTGSTLQRLKIRESVVKVEHKCYHSMEIKGVILPHMVHNLCELMQTSSLDRFSLTFLNVESTKPFSFATFKQIESSPGLSPTKKPLAPPVFGQQNLSDSGLKPSVLSKFCSRETRQFDSIKFSDSKYSCI